MLRRFRSADLSAVQELAVAAGMFSSEEAAFLASELVPSSDRGVADPGTEAECVVSDSHEGIDGVVYYRPEEAADGVWDLTMIAVHPNRQRGGVGHDLVQHVEGKLRARGARLLAIRTSGTDHYAGTRAFYARSGYVRAATVSDWWADGDDLILFTKRLT